jgi:hypothetical protein
MAMVVPPPRLSSDERVCFQRTLDILEATASLLSQRSGGGSSSSPSSPAAGGDPFLVSSPSMLHHNIIAANTTVASSCQQLEDLVRLCVDLLLVDGDAKRLLVLLEDERFLFVLRRLLAMNLKHAPSAAAAPPPQQFASPSTPTSIQVGGLAGNSSGGGVGNGSLTSPTAASRAQLGNGSFGSVSFAAPVVTPYMNPAIGASFTPIAFSLFQTNLLSIVRDVFVAISSSPSAVALVAPRLSQDMWLELLMRFLGLQKHQSAAECTVLEAVYVLSGILQQGETSSAFVGASAPLRLNSSSGAVGPPTMTPKRSLRQLLLVVEEDDVLVMLARLEHGYHNVTVRNFALGTLRLWLCSRPLTSSTTAAVGRHVDAAGEAVAPHYLSSTSDVAPLREAVGAVMAWILTADAAAGRVFEFEGMDHGKRLAPIAPSVENFHIESAKLMPSPQAASSNAIGVVECAAPQQQRIIPQQLRYSLMTVAEILSGFVLSDSTYVPHGVLAQQRADRLLTNLILLRRSTLQYQTTATLTAARRSATGGGGAEVAVIDASIETLLLCSEAMARVQSIGMVMRSLLHVDEPSAFGGDIHFGGRGSVDVGNLISSLQTSRWLRCSIQTLLSARRLDDILSALHDPRMMKSAHEGSSVGLLSSYGADLYPQETLWSILQRSILHSPTGMSAAHDSTTSSKPPASSVVVVVSEGAQTELALGVAMIVVAASRQPTRRVLLREMCMVGQLYQRIVALVHGAFLHDGHRGELFVLLYGPDGELLNSVQFVDRFIPSSPVPGGGGSKSRRPTSSRHHPPNISKSTNTQHEHQQQQRGDESPWQQPEVLLDAVKYILDPARGMPLRDTLELMARDNSHRRRADGSSPANAAADAVSSSPAALVQKRHTLATALISWAVLQAVSPTS